MDTVSALGNWAMSMGRIPSRYSIEGKPDPEGLFDASLGWRRGDQPLKVNLWSRSENQTLAMSLRSCVSRAVHSVAKEEPKGQI